MLKPITIALLLMCSIDSFAQTQTLTHRDSIVVNNRIGLMGRWQTGNLNQISVMPNGSISLSKTSFYSEVNVSYHFLRVNGFTAKNDFWANGLFQYHPSNSLFPSIYTRIGFASSFLIDHSSLTGAGVGLNVVKKSRKHFLQIHLFTGYLSFKHKLESKHTALGLGSLIRAKIPLSEKAFFRWELSSYHSTKTSNFWGGANLLQLNFILLKGLVVNLNHQTYYNNETAQPIKKINTEMLFGIQYHISNN